MKPPIPILVATGLALASTTLRASSDPAHPLQPSAPRTVAVSESQTPPVVRAGLLQSTLIVLPAEEKVANVFAGDTVDWVFDGGHVASRFISVKPKTANGSTDIHIVSDHGNEYTLQLREVSEDTDAHYDSKVLIEPGDKAAKDRLTELPVFVPAAELEEVKHEAAAAQAAQPAMLKAEKAQEEEYRSQYPELLKAVEHLSRHETALGISILQQHGSVTQIVEPQARFEAIAKNYALQPENTLIVSPDNASRREINEAVRQELKAHGIVDRTDHQFKVLVPRSEMTGADRRWASQYEVGDVLRYQRGSKQFGLERGSYAEVIAVDANNNLITVQPDIGGTVSYDPARVRGIDAYREEEKSFAIGDRFQMTAPYRDLDLPNRALGKVEQIVNGELTVRMDSGRTVTFDPHEMRHFDHGYAVTSHSAQGLTAERVLVNMDTEMHSNLINARFAYVAISRGSHEAQIFTDNENQLGERLNHDVSKTSAMNITKEEEPTKALTHDHSLTAPSGDRSSTFDITHDERPELKLLREIR